MHNVQRLVHGRGDVERQVPPPVTDKGSVGTKLQEELKEGKGPVATFKGVVQHKLSTGIL